MFAHEKIKQNQIDQARNEVNYKKNRHQAMIPFTEQLDKD